MTPPLLVAQLAALADVAEYGRRTDASVGYAFELCLSLQEIAACLRWTRRSIEASLRRQMRRELGRRG